jgi:molybdenum cofactor sulfurtransferase
MEDLITQNFGKSREEELVCEGHNVAYLDYAGCPPVSKSLLHDVFHELSTQALANPHSYAGTPTLYAIQTVRAMTLEHFHLSSEHYEVIFTSGATASVKLMAECFPWSKDSEFIYSKNAHNSLMGMRNLAPNYRCLPASAFFSHNNEASVDVSTTIHSETIFHNHGISMPALREDHNNPVYSLLAVPGECNFSGAKLNFQQLLMQYKSLQYTNPSHHYLWLLDAAKLAGSSAIMLQQLPIDQRPHFLCLSYYKIFGYPTGIGALLIRKDIMSILNKRYFGGGTLLAGAADSVFLQPRDKTSPEHYEDGTPNFHAITGHTVFYRVVS